MSGPARTQALHEILAPYCIPVLVGALVHLAISYGPIYLLHAALVLMAARMVMVLAETRTLTLGLPQGALEWSGLAFVGLYVLSWMWSTDRVHSIAYVAYMVIGVVTATATAVLASSRSGLVRVLRVAGWITAIQIVICLLEILTPFRMPVSPFSPYASLFGRTDKLATVGVPDAVLQQVLQSPTGFHWNPNNLAIVMVIALAFFINLRSRLWRWTGSAAALTIIVFTASRASILGVLVMVFVYLAVLSPRRLGVTIAIAPLLLAGLWFSAQHLDRLYERLGPVAGAVEAATALFAPRQVQSDSIGIRQQLMNNAIASIQDSGGVGIGPGGSLLVQRAAGGIAAEIGSTHNYWLEIAVDAGVPALLVLVGWYMIAWLTCLEAAVYSRDPVFRYSGRSLVCALAGFSVALVSASSVLYFPPMWAMFGLVIGMRRARRRDHGYADSIAGAGLRPSSRSGCLVT